MMQCRRRCLSLQIDNLENRTVRLLDFSLTNGISIFRKSVWNVSAPTFDGVSGSSSRSLPPGRRRMWICQFVFQMAPCFGTFGWQRCWRRLRVTVLRASESMEPVRRMAQLTIRPPNVVSVTARTLRRRCPNFCIKSKNKSASPMKRRPINPNLEKNRGS